jgi:hypothetical protein
MFMTPNPPQPPAACNEQRMAGDHGGETLPENQSGADKRWVERTLRAWDDACRRHRTSRAASRDSRRPR